jgi:hypothetical protein
MLGVDSKCVAVAEPCHEVLVINDKTWCLPQNRVLCFIEIIKNIKHKHKRGMV